MIDIVERLRTDVLWHQRRGNDTIAADCREAADEITRLRAALATPPEWVLVPVEATEAMCKAAVIYANGNAVYRNVASEALKIEEAIYGEAYAAMLAAAPGAPDAQPKGEA